jgi:hypothetical protein
VLRIEIKLSRISEIRVNGHRGVVQMSDKRGKAWHPKHQATLDINGLGIRTYDITDEQYDYLMRNPWNTPLRVGEELLEPRARGFLVVDVR